jgi:hypothetical protein
MDSQGYPYICYYDGAASPDMVKVIKSTVTYDNGWPSTDWTYTLPDSADGTGVLLALTSVPIYCIYTQTGAYDLYGTYWNGATWSTPELISNDARGGWDGFSAAPYGDVIDLVWATNTTVMGRQYVYGDGWGTAVDIRYPDHDGYAYTMFRRPQVCYLPQYGSMIAYSCDVDDGYDTYKQLHLRTRIGLWTSMQTLGSWSYDEVYNISLPVTLGNTNAFPFIGIWLDTYNGGELYYAWFWSWYSPGVNNLTVTSEPTGATADIYGCPGTIQIVTPWTGTCYYPEISVYGYETYEGLPFIGFNPQGGEGYYWSLPSYVNKLTDGSVAIMYGNYSYLAIFEGGRP